MGTLNFLVNHKKQQIFVLGKCFPSSVIADCHTEEDLRKEVFHWLDETSDKQWAAKIIFDILSTIGLQDNVGMTDTGNDELFDECVMYMVVGSVYEDDEDVGHPFIHHRRYLWKEHNYRPK